MGMDRERSEVARRRLVEGYPVKVGGIVRRVFPRQALVAHEIGVPASTVMRWAARTGIAEARAARLAQDRRDGTAVPVAIEDVPPALLRLVVAHVDAGYAVAPRDRARTLRLIDWMLGFSPLGTAELQRCRVQLTQMLAAPETE